MKPPDLSDFDAEAARSRPGMPLKLDRVLADLPDDRVAALRAALEDDRYSAGVIARTLRSWGEQVDESSVRKWRQHHLRT